MQVVLEVFSLFAVFLIFRQSILAGFPIKKVDIEISVETKKALTLYRRKFYFLMVLTSIVFVFAFFKLLDFGFELFRENSSAENVLYASKSSFFIPALILGLITARFTSDLINIKLQVDGMAFFYEEYQDDSEGYSRKRWRQIQILLGLILSVVMLVFQYNTFLIHKDGILFYYDGFHDHKEFKISQIDSIISKSNGHFQIVISEGDTLNTEKFGGDIDSFIKELKAQGD